MENFKTGSFVNEMYANSNTKPCHNPGTKCTNYQKATLCLYTDRHVYFVTGVNKDQTRCTIVRAKATRTDSNGMCEQQNYSYEYDFDAREKLLHMRRGQWCEVILSTSQMKVIYKPVHIIFGRADEYYDFSF
jgi:hypothetical protein